MVGVAMAAARARAIGILVARSADLLQPTRLAAVR
jgi:hypothetical protein